MKSIVTGAVVVIALAVPAAAAPGQCSVTGYGTFDCDVSADGGGLTFGLPDGAIFVLGIDGEGVGTGYRIAADAAPGTQPQGLGRFDPDPDMPGCWLGAREATEVCAMVQQ